MFSASSAYLIEKEFLAYRIIYFIVYESESSCINALFLRAFGNGEL